MRWIRLMTFATLVATAGAAAAQTAGGPATASPGAMPTNTPLTTSGIPRSSDTATPASPAAIGAHKPARPRAAHRRRAAHRTAPATTPDADTTNQ